MLTGSTMSIGFGTMEVVDHFVLADVTSAATVVASKRVLSLDNCALVVRPLFFGIEAML